MRILIASDECFKIKLNQNYELVWSGINMMHNNEIMLKIIMKGNCFNTWGRWG